MGVAHFRIPSSTWSSISLSSVWKSDTWSHWARTLLFRSASTFIFAFSAGVINNGSGSHVDRLFDVSDVSIVNESLRRECASGGILQRDVSPGGGNSVQHTQGLDCQRPGSACRPPPSTFPRLLCQGKCYPIHHLTHYTGLWYGGVVYIFRCELWVLNRVTAIWSSYNFSVITTQEIVLAHAFQRMAVILYVNSFDQCLPLLC